MLLDLSSVFVTVKEIIIPDEDVIYRETPDANLKIDKQNSSNEEIYQYEDAIYSKMEELVKQ